MSKFETEITVPNCLEYRICDVDNVLVTQSMDDTFRVKVIADRGTVVSFKNGLIHGPDRAGQGMVDLQLQVPKNFLHLSFKYVRGAVRVNDINNPKLLVHGEECLLMVVDNSALDKVFSDASVVVKTSVLRQFNAVCTGGNVYLEDMQIEENVAIQTQWGHVNLRGCKCDDVVTIATKIGAVFVRSVNSKGVWIEAEEGKVTVERMWSERLHITYKPADV